MKREQARTIRRLYLVLCVVLFVFGATAHAQDAPRFLQPTLEVFTSEEISLLGRAVEELDAALVSCPWASRMQHDDRGWNSEQFSRYGAGVLRSLGYRVVLVGREATNTQARVWLALAIDLPARTAWIPVDATPPEGDIQTVIGRILWEAEQPLAWPSRFAADTIRYDIVLPIGANVLPIARIDRIQGKAGEPGELVWLSAKTSVDPDGDIVLYVWDFGDGESLVTTTARTQHRYTESGAYSVRLIVVDNFGGHAASEPTEVVMVEPEEPPTRPTGGCNCGG